MKWTGNSRFRRALAGVMILTMAVCMMPAGLMAEKAEAATTLKDPRIVGDASMEAGQRVTWDCVWFGSYPQSEVVCETDSDAIADLEAMNVKFGVEYIKVSEAAWSSIVGASYDSNGEAVTGGRKYRRIKRADATYAASGNSYYNWKDGETYHYFIYEPVKWRVLDVDGNDALLLADKALDDQRYNYSYTNITWEKSTVRSWLNAYDSTANRYGSDFTGRNFINTAFTSGERSAIKTTDVVNDDNLKYGTAGGNDTRDKIFLLSESEVYSTDKASSYGFSKQLSAYDEGRRCKSSTFAKAMGTWSRTSDSYKGNCVWWLRSPGYNTTYAANVYDDGFVNYYGGNVYYDYNAVRPALHLDLSSSDIYSYAGTVCSDGTGNEEGGGPVDPGAPDKPVITEDQLFGEYAGYLNNRSYKNMCGEIRSEVEDDILWSRSESDNWFSALKSCMKAGAWGNIRSIISGFSGKYYDEKKLEETLALDLLQAVSQDSNISDEIMADVKSAHKIASDIDKGAGYALKYGFKNSAQKVKVAEQLSGGLFTKDDILVLIENAEENEAKWNQDLKSLGIAVDAANMAINIALTMEANHEIVTKLMQSVDKDTPLYRGLSSIDKKLKHTAVENVMPKLLEYGIDKCGGALIDAASGAVAPVELGFRVVGALMPTSGIEDVNRLVIASSNTAQLSEARDDMITKFIADYRNGGNATAELKDDYKLIYTAYLESLDSSVSYALKVATDKQKKKLKKDYERIKKSLTYDKYIESCLANANADWSYEVRNGKAVVKGYTVRKNTASGKSSAKASVRKAASAAGDGYSLDIPETIDGYSVAAVNESAFRGDSSLKCVTIPDDVGNIGSSAFASCTGLDTVYLGSSLETIGGSAFEDCSFLSLVYIPYSVQEIGEGAFAGISDLVIEAQEGTSGQDYAKNNSNVSFEGVESRVVSIAIEEMPAKLSYKMSEETDPAGMTVKARYEDGTEKDVTKYCSSTFIDKKPGTVSVEVRFNEAAVTYDVQVTADECEYTVRYEDECGNEIADRTSAKAMAGTAVTLKAPDISGYTADDQELSRVVGADSEFVITYTSEPEKSIKDAEVTYKKEHRYTGRQIRPEVTVTCGGRKLKEGEDYYIDYDTNTEPGKGGIMICGRGAYCDDIWLDFDIKDDSIFGGSNMIRIAGDNRYDTSEAAADALKKSLEVDRFDNIIVASGSDYPDALSGSYLAKVKDAPVMLTGKDTATEAAVRQYIGRNLKKGGTVYLLGGTGAVTARFEKSLKGFNVERLGGKTRYETNIEILKAAGADREDLLVCTGEGFADSLSASAVGKPILLAAGSGLAASQEKYLDKLEINDIYLIGGSSVVSDRIGKQLRSYDQDGRCERVAGKNRYLTSIAVAEKFFPDSSRSAVLAYAMNFPDGLAGGPLALSMNAPLILTDNDSSGTAAEYAGKAGIKRAVVLGGPELISDSAVNRIIK